MIHKQILFAISRNSRTFGWHRLVCKWNFECFNRTNTAAKGFRDRWCSGLSKEKKNQFKKEKVKVKKSGSVRSGIRTHASIRRPEHPVPCFMGRILILESGALDRSAILTTLQGKVDLKYLNCILFTLLHLFVKKITLIPWSRRFINQKTNLNILMLNF